MLNNPTADGSTHVALCQPPCFLVSRADASRLGWIVRGGMTLVLLERVVAVVFFGLRVLFIYHFFAYVGTASGSAATNALNEFDNEVLHRLRSLTFSTVQTPRRRCALQVAPLPPFGRHGAERFSVIR